MRKRGLFGLVVTFIHDLISPFDPEEDDRKFRYNFSQAHRHASPRSAEASQNWEPSELKHLLEPWDFLDEETWEKIYRGELPAEDYMSTVHVFPPPQDRSEGTAERILGPNASPNDYAEKVFRAHAMADPTPESSEKIVIVSEDIVESVIISGEESSPKNDSMAGEKSNEATVDGNSEDSFESADNSFSESMEFDNPDAPDYIG